MLSRLVGWSVLLGLAPFALIAQDSSVSAPASTHPFSLFGGLSVQRGEPHYGLGFQVGARYIAWTARRLTLRFDISYQHFSYQYPPESPPCPPPGCPPPAKDIKALSSNISAVLGDASVIALTAGLGLHSVVQSPHDGSFFRPGWNFGLSAPMGRSVYLDVQYLGLIGPETMDGFIPVTLGVRF